ncbi:MAG: WD40/YVTN/BNR-like repeat-containing protein, partial [Ignavibacteria bacterium]
MKLLFTLLIAIFAFAPTISAREKEKEGNPLERFKDFHARRAFPYTDIPKDLLGKAKQTMNQMIEKKGGASLLAAQPEWKLLGPTSVGGRIRSASVHPTNPDIVYVGAANGGVWKTTNGGYLWEPLMDFENSSSMGQVVIDPNNPSIIYAATGEDRGGSYGYAGSGIYRSTDEGKSWKLIGLATVGAFMSFKVHPLNSNVLYAGGMNANAGFYRSTDAGATWERTYSKGVRDISIDPKNINHLFIASPGNGVYKSIDGGMTFTYCKMPGYGEGDNLDLAKFGHITVQMAPSNPSIVYSLYEDGENRLGTIVKSTDGGESWVPCFDDDGTFFNSQGSYDIYISVHPSNPNIVLAGGIDVYRTTNGGAVWDNITRVYTGGNQHPDQHCATFAPSNHKIVYAGNDGGMMKSEDAGENWETINNQLAITQYHAFGIDQSQSAMAYGGAQDNGTTAVNSAGYGDIVGGDGGFTMVDFVNPNTVYASTQNGAMYRIQMNTRQVGRIGASLP